MKEVSIYLWKFMQTVFSKKKYIHQTNMFSEKSRHFLEHLMNQIRKGEKLWNDRKSKIQGVEITDIPKGNNYGSIDPEFQSTIESTPSFSKKYTFQLLSRTYSVFFVLPILSENVSKDSVDIYFEKAIEKIFISLSLLGNYASSHCSQHMNIYIYLTEHTKFLPEKKRAIGTKHANTGFTTSCKMETEIILYREEEWFKVLLHELFHNLGLDFSGMQETFHEYSRKKILELFSVDSEVNLFETYCEMWAELMNAMFYVMFSEKKGENLESLEKTIQYEQLFSLFQSTKVLHHFDIDYKTITNLSKKCKAYKENTNILSYYILKSIGLFYLNDFLEWVLENNNGSLDFTKTTENLEKYCAFFQDHYQRPEYIEKIKKMENWFSNYSKKYENTLEIKTLRMVLFDWL